MDSWMYTKVTYSLVNGHERTKPPRKTKDEEFSIRHANGRITLLPYSTCPAADGMVPYNSLFPPVERILSSSVRFRNNKE